MGVSKGMFDDDVSVNGMVDVDAVSVKGLVGVDVSVMALLMLMLPVWWYG